MTARSQKNKLRFYSKVSVKSILGEPVKQTVAFMRVDNIENLYIFVKKSGWTQISEITRQHWGGKECDVTTIDGGTIRFFQID